MFLAEKISLFVKIANDIKKSFNVKATLDGTDVEYFLSDAALGSMMYSQDGFYATCDRFRDILWMLPFFLAFACLQYLKMSISCLLNAVFYGSQVEAPIIERSLKNPAIKLLHAPAFPLCSVLFLCLIF